MIESSVVLEISELARDFGGRVVLDDVSLTVNAGEILALLGPNGVGKSTLLKLTAGLLKPSRGDARIWRRSCWLGSIDLHRVACVLDGATPPSRVRVREILDLKACVHPRFDRSLAQSLCEQHQIGLTSRWHTLSKGQKRWVLLVAALASEVELMLLDEPADGLDVATRRELYGLLRQQANDRGLTVVVASHIIADVERVADDIAILVQGRLRLHSPLEQLRDEACAIELHDESSLEALSTVAEVISSRRFDEHVLAVIRFRSPYLAEQELTGEIRRQPVSLEDLYLAYTQPGRAIASSETAVA